MKQIILQNTALLWHRSAKCIKVNYLPVSVLFNSDLQIGAKTPGSKNNHANGIPACAYS